MKGKEKEYTKDTDFATIIYNLRTKHHLTQKQLADLINVSDRTVSKWENGQTVPDIINIQNICESLGVSPSYIVHAKRNFKDRFRRLFKKLTRVLNYLVHNVFILGFIIIFIILLLYFINNYNALKFYKLKYDSEDITFNSGYLIQTKTVNVLAITDIDIPKFDYDKDTINLTLYTYFNGDKTVLYESDNLASILIEELRSYPDVLTIDNIENLKNNLYLDVSFKDNNGKDHLLTIVITLIPDFINNKIIYSNSNPDRSYNPSYIKYLTSNLPKYKSPLNILMDKFEDNNIKPVAEEEINLESLGYKYNFTSKSYMKKNKNETIEFFPSLETLIYTITIDDIKYKYVYYIDESQILKYIYNLNGKPKVTDKIFVKNNYNNIDPNISRIIRIYEELQSLSK